MSFFSQYLLARLVIKIASQPISKKGEKLLCIFCFIPLLIGFLCLLAYIGEHIGPILCVSAVFAVLLYLGLTEKE